MKLKIQDREYVFEDKLTVDEAMFIYEKSKVGLAGLWAELTVGNPFVVAGMLYVAKRRSGEAVQWKDLLKLDMATFEILPDDEATPDEDDPEAEPTPDPTPLSGKTRKRASTATSSH